MTKKSERPKRPNKHAQAMALRRAASMTAERRREIALMGSTARWGKKKDVEKS